MQILRWYVCGIAVLSLAAVVDQNDYKVKVKGRTYDLSTLAGLEMDRCLSEPDGSGSECHSFALYGTVMNSPQAGHACKGFGSAIFTKSTTAGTVCHIMANHGPMEARPLVDPTMVGLELDLAPGQECWGPGRHRQVTVQMLCDENVTQPVYTSAMMSSDGCSATYQVRARQACPLPATWTDIEYVAEFIKEEEHELVAYATSSSRHLLNCILLVLLVYLVGGSYINFSRGARGIEVIPNLPFWVAYPQLVWDGVIFSWIIMRDTFDPNYHAPTVESRWNNKVSSNWDRANPDRDTFSHFTPVDPATKRKYNAV